jgi:hypothetical protein
MPIFDSNGKILTRTDQDGNAQFYYKKNGTFTLGDKSNKIIPVQVPYASNGGILDFGTQYAPHTDLDMNWLIKFITNRPKIQEDPNAACWITDWDPNILKEGGIIPLTLINFNDYFADEFAGVLDNISNQLALMTRGKYCLPTFVNCIRKTEPASSIEEEGRIWDKYRDDNEFKGIFWCFNQYDTFPSGNAWHVPTSETDPHIVYKGGIITRRSVSGIPHVAFEEALTVGALMSGEAQDIEKYSASIFSGGMYNDFFTDNYTYHGVLYSPEVVMGRTRFAFPRDTKLTWEKIDIPQKKFD